jgi:hypothetical protein
VVQLSRAGGVLGRRAFIVQQDGLFANDRALLI